MKRNRFRIFFGWWTVLVTGLLSGIGNSFYIYGMSALFKPISSELGFSRAATSVAAGINRLEGGFDSLLTGWLVDKFGPRWVMMAGLFVMTIGLLMMNLVNSLWTYYLIWGVIIGVGRNVSLVIAVDKTLTEWFIKKRGTAVGLKFAIMSLLGVFILPLVTWLINLYSWRSTCSIWAFITFAGIPFVVLFVRSNRPEYYGLLPDGAESEGDSVNNRESMVEKGVAYAKGMEEVEFTLRQAMKTPAYWVIIAVFTCHVVVMASINIHCIPFLTDMGIDPLFASGMMGFMIFFMMPTRFLSGYFSDRVPRNHLRYIVSIAFVFELIGIGVLLIYPTRWTLYMFLALYGMGSGIPTTVIVIMFGRYYGRKAYGSIHGTTNFFRAPLTLIFPVYTGWIFDRTGSYTTAFVVFWILLLIGLVFISFVRPPKAPDRITEIKDFI